MDSFLKRLKTEAVPFAKRHLRKMLLDMVDELSARERAR
ncbi:MAG: hypothetical protein QOD83_5076 [Solirubrobacteraceae bacterium]|jgi:hypothetical protein|nr:hypothetical protein [Solirubrobacteraceae bacterium]